MSLYLQAYWRSCAALLGQVLNTAFKDDYAVELISTPEVPGEGTPPNACLLSIPASNERAVGFDLFVRRSQQGALLS